MIRHIVMYRLNHSNDESRRALVDKFMTMKGEIPSLIDVEAGYDTLGSERSFDVALTCTFESLEELDNYKVHPFHQGIVTYVKSVIKSSHSVDYEVQS